MLLALAAAVVALLVRMFVAQAFVIPSGSMEPLLRPGDRVVVLSLGGQQVQRGDVVVFDGDGLFSSGSSGAREDSDFVKRVIGLPGERIACCDQSGRITVDGEPLDEPYVYPGDAPSTQAFDVIVPEGRLWLLGDHRGDSADSRAHLGDPGGGMVPVDRVVGRVVSIAWPISRWDGVGRVDLVPGGQR